jgi:hypothetical protein
MKINLSPYPDDARKVFGEWGKFKSGVTGTRRKATTHTGHCFSDGRSEKAIAQQFVWKRG